MKTKLPIPQKLPSGAYRCRVMVDGKRESVVDDDPRAAQAKAVALQNGLLKQNKKPESLTVGEAIDRYIESKDAVLSPSTVNGYKKIRKYYIQHLMGIKLSDLTQDKVQREINQMAKERSPKTVRNAHGLLSAALTEYYPDLILRTTLPQKRHYEAAIPSGDDILKILAAARGTKGELPIYLAIWLGLRESEIRGITWDSIEGSELHVRQAIVEGESGPVVKGTKTYSGDRKIRIPPYIMSLINAQPHTSDFLISVSGKAIYSQFSRLCERIGLPHYRFHDLRHANASVMLALGVPDKYAMERMGHATTNMLKTVYQHTMKDKQKQVADLVDNYFEEKLDTILDTKLK